MKGSLGVPHILAFTMLTSSGVVLGSKQCSFRDSLFRVSELPGLRLCVDLLHLTKPCVTWVTASLRESLVVKRSKSGRGNCYNSLAIPSGLSRSFLNCTQPNVVTRTLRPRELETHPKLGR